MPPTSHARSVNTSSPSVVRDSTMTVYYRDYYPFAAIYAAYAQAGGERGTCREMAFRWGEKMSRWRSLGASAGSFGDAVKRSNPSRVEIGPLYDAPVDDRPIYGRQGLVPTERELVFDIDLDAAFDPLRSCGCTDKRYCERCWPLVTASACLLDLLLRDMYAFRRLLWVYSGRRGLHCWIFDESARRLNAAARAQIVKRVEDVRNVFNSDHRAVSSAPLLPRGFLERAHALFREHLDRNTNLFECAAVVDTCKSLIDRPEDVDAFTRLVRGSVVQSSKSVRAKKSARQLWDTIFKVFASTPAKARYAHKIALHFCFPRLDRAVTESMNHLLKLPFCVHPATGHVCVAVAAAALDRFYPDESRVPDVAKLCGAVDGQSDATEQQRALFRSAVDLLTSEIS